jgi:hypothetical protein
MEDKIISAGPALAMALIFSALGIDHLARFSHHGGVLNLLIGLALLAALPVYLKRFQRDWTTGLH